MNNQDLKIHIVGAGVSGLIAAKVLQDNGYRSVMIESTDRVGGRVKTDVTDEFQLDHGFQVLLTGYPAAQKYLDFEQLNLQEFLPGASIFKDKKQRLIGDPLRSFSLLFPTLFSRIGNFSDKLKVLRLNKRLKNKSVSAIFEEPEQTTLEYLEQFGFSTSMINDFFRPFFSGIFLEIQLDTSSRMFEFVYKMFGEGYAAIPKSGIEAIPKQLAGNLTGTEFRFNTKVTEVRDGEITFDDNTKIESDFTIIATEASNLLPNLKDQGIAWKSCRTLYFETKKRVIQKKLIGLIPKKGSLINNIFFHTSLETESVSEKELLSVTVIDHQNLSGEQLVKAVEKELAEYCAIDSVHFLKQYIIPMALPNLTNVRYEMEPSETRITERVFLAGDTQLNGSLNAAMLSGEKAALGVIESITSTFV